MKFIRTPSSGELERELKREQYKIRYQRTLQSTLYILISAAAAAVLVAMLWLPVLQIYGSSMTPTLQEGDTVVSVKLQKYEAGDIIAFYYGNKLLVKRYIAGPGSWVDIQEDGTVIVDDVALEEPYLLIFPAAIVSLITITFYLVGNAFSDAADPRTHV